MFCSFEAIFEIWPLKCKWADFALYTFLDLKKKNYTKCIKGTYLDQKATEGVEKI